jgi:hypothetical protein
VSAPGRTRRRSWRLERCVQAQRQWLQRLRNESVFRPVVLRTYVRMKEDDAERRCGRCGEVQPLEAFAWRRKAKGQRHNMCRPCHSQYHHEHYSANKARYIQQARERKQTLARDRTAWLLTYFESHPCADCGETDPIVLEFDHSRDKQFNIGSALAYRRWETILTEIAKCDRRLRKLPPPPNGASARVGALSSCKRTEPDGLEERAARINSFSQLGRPPRAPVQNPWRIGGVMVLTGFAQGFASPPSAGWLHEPNRIHRRRRRRPQRGAGRAGDRPGRP